MNRHCTLRLPAVAVAISLAAGCMTARTGGEDRGRLLFDAVVGTTFRNHVRPVADPVHGDGIVLLGERVSGDRCQMTFVNRDGFFVVPEGHTGRVTVRVLVRGEGRIRIALVSRRKLRSYYFDAPPPGQWTELELPLTHVEGRIEEGSPVNDITMWLLSSAKGEPLEKNAAVYFDRAVFHP